MSWARIHRWLAILLVVLLVVWSLTGLLFHLKPGWSRAYDQLTIERRDVSLQLATLQPLASLPGGAARIELFDTALGPLYRLRTAKGTELLDARTGEPRSLTSDDARLLAADAIRRSSHRASYGDIASIRVREDTARIELTGGPTVSLGLRDGRMSQEGADTRRIDWLYRIHYLQWTGNAAVDKVLAVAGLALIWAVMIPGIVLFVRRVRR